MTAVDARAPVDESAVQAAERCISADRLRELVQRIVDVPSPTGEEAPLAAVLAAELHTAGLDARVQPLDDSQANAVGRLRGAGSGPDLLLYAPIDTLTTGRAEDDLPWAGPELRPDLLPTARVTGDLVVGLGAGNPKGHVACVLAAAEAVAAAGLPLKGDLLAAFGAGGMPTNALPGPRRATGQGAGCSFLLEQGGWADMAVIAKPGWAVSHEEVGLAWLELRVHGSPTYVGSRHRLPYDNAVAGAAALVLRLERWFEEYAVAHTDGLVSPQGVVGAVEGGWTRMPAVTPAVCRVLVDLRLSPRTGPLQARRELTAFVDRVAAELGLRVDVELVLAVPGTTTDPQDWVVRSAVAAWEHVEGRAHEPQTGTSGATDANILRSRGVPTARIGMPKVPPADLVAAGLPVDFFSGMNTVSVREMVRLTRHLVRVAVDTLLRDREEVGLP